MSKEDLLNDLENFVDSDWKKVFEKFQDEEYEKEVGQPVIPDFPSYGEFYQALVELVTKVDIPHQLGFLIHKILAYQDRKASESFDNIWSLFCDPHGFKTDHIKCPNCDFPHTVIYKKSHLPVWHHRRRDMVIQEHTIKQETVHCIRCGSGFYYVAGRIVGVFSNRRID